MTRMTLADMPLRGLAENLDKPVISLGRAIKDDITPEQQRQVDQICADALIDIRNRLIDLDVWTDEHIKEPL